MYYFAVGNYHLGGGIMVTASHNPPEWHGAKMVREGCIPLSSDAGLSEIKEFIDSGEKVNASNKGRVVVKDILDDFCHYALSWINIRKIKPLKIVYNPNFGFEGMVLQRLVKISGLPLELIPLNEKPDGSFPKGRPDPFRPENRPETENLVKKTKADLGVAWDADADRVFFFSEQGEFIEPYFTNTLLIAKMLEKEKGGKIIYDPRYTWALIEAAEKAKGKAILERVGHSFIKARMRQEDAIFAGESSGHTYFRDFWYADSGILPLLLILEILSEKEKSFSALLAPVMSRYFVTGEINFQTPKAKEIMESAAKKYQDGKISWFDGISVEYPQWRFNLRASNTEPLLRLNLEAKSKKLMEEKKKEVMEFIQSNS